jgi:hypothetical protein
MHARKVKRQTWPPEIVVLCYWTYDMHTARFINQLIMQTTLAAAAAARYTNACSIHGVHDSKRERKLTKRSTKIVVFSL